MRIAMVGPRGVPASYSGVETAAEQLGRRLVERGHEVTVFCRRHHYGGDEPRTWLGMRRVTIGGVATKHLDTITHSLAAAARVDKRHYDVALVSIVGNLPVAALLRARGVPVVFNVDGTDSDRDKWAAPARLYLSATELVAGWAADVLVTDAEALRSRFDKGRAALRVIPYGSERPRRPPDQELARLGLVPDGYLIHVGRLVPENGALQVVRAHRELDPRPPLLVLGDAAYADDYVAQVRAAAAPEVVMAGYLFGEAYEELMTSARALVVATRVGGTHPVVVEGMGFGLAVVVPDVPVMREVVGEAGIYHHDQASLAAGLRMVWDDPAQARAHGAAAAERARDRYAWEAVTDAYEEALAEAVRRRREPGADRPAPRARPARRSPRSPEGDRRPR